MDSEFSLLNPNLSSLLEDRVPTLLYKGFTLLLCSYVLIVSYKCIYNILYHNAYVNTPFVYNHMLMDLFASFNLHVVFVNMRYSFQYCSVTIKLFNNG